MAGKKNPNLGDKLRQEREGAENTLRDSRSKPQIAVRETAARKSGTPKADSSRGRSC